MESGASCRPDAFNALVRKRLNCFMSVNVICPSLEPVRVIASDGDWNRMLDTAGHQDEHLAALFRRLNVDDLIRFNIMHVAKFD